MQRPSKALLIIPVLFILIFALLLFFHAKKSAPPTPSDEIIPPLTVSSQSNPAPENIYLLIAEDGYLNLYENLSVKHSERLDSSLPSADLSALSLGIRFSSAEEAYSTMESFIN